MCVQYETGVSLVVQIVKNLHAMQETQVQSLGQEDPLEKGTVHGVTKSQTWLNDQHFQRYNPLAIQQHSSDRDV